jgi:hypothetical protein
MKGTLQREISKCGNDLERNRWKKDVLSDLVDERRSFVAKEF